MNQKIAQEMEENVKKYGTEFIKARMIYIHALAVQEITESIDKESKTAVLRTNEFYVDEKEWDKDEEKGRILTPERDYLMNKEDFNRYLDLCQTERTKRGLKIPDKNFTSDYQTFKELKEAENKFLEIAFKVLPKELAQELEPIKTSMCDIRKKFIDICLKLKVGEQND